MPEGKTSLEIHFHFSQLNSLCIPNKKRHVTPNNNKNLLQFRKCTTKGFPP